MILNDQRKQNTYIVDEKDLNLNVIKCVNQDQKKCILIKNSEESIISSSIQMDNVIIRFNIVLLHLDKKYYYHIIESKNNDVVSEYDFEIIFEYVFNKLENPTNENELRMLINSLDNYFRTTKEKEQKSLQIGVYGEMLTIVKLYELGYEEILNKYHKKFNLKHDFEINKETRIEVKTTCSGNRIHKFRHDQICRDDIELFIISVMLEESQEDISLFELIENVIEMTNDIDIKFELKSLMKLCGVSPQNKGLSFSYKKALNSIKAYNAIELPKISNESIPEGVIEISYSIDCNTANSLDIEEFALKLKELN